MICPRTQKECASSYYCGGLKSDIENGLKPESRLGRVLASLPAEVGAVLESYCVEEQKIALVGLVMTNLDPDVELAAGHHLDQISFSQRLFKD